ncbi:MAG: Crp/Fnr family transcriptional regulator [Bdellovibrionales bacterium]|nr:Crp/Fnr family transcriptional regulator [Bdellovibrionales bacterium]
MRALGAKSVAGLLELKKGEILFNEGDASDAMYVIKAGRIAITKKKGNSEIELAELKPGEMLGEMAFFDNKPRSAGAKAKTNATVIKLPFVALHAQFKTFPEWLKAMVKTVNAHLRNANQRIKNLESSQSGTEEMFPPHTVTRLCAILSLIGYKSGRKEETGLVIPQWTLRNYTIQIFQQPTHKMQKMMDVLTSLNIMTVEDLGEGKQKITITDHEKLTGFVDWYNEYLFKDESKRVTVEERELPIIRALIHFGRKQTANEKGEVTVSLTHIQQNSLKDLGIPTTTNDSDGLAKKGLVQDKQSAEGGELTQTFLLPELEKILPFWEIVYTIEKYNKNS